ncbi:MAG TPA: DUF4349 domain-containing protein [Thermoleophilaceae bacterium]|jgi:hypothetical protein
MTDVLTAIDDALETGVAADEDPLTRELQELALALRDDAPEPTPVYREWLGKQVEAGFPKKRSSKPPWWRRMMSPALATGLIVVPLVVLVIVAGGGNSDLDSVGGGGGGVAADSGASDAQGAEGGGSAAEPGAGDDAGGGSAGATSERTAKSEQALSRSPALAVPPAEDNFAPGRSDRRIERSISLELEMPVDEMSRVAEQVTAVTNRHGGFVLSSSVSTGEDSSGGDFSLRIPATELRPAIRDLSALADVRSQSQSGRDVTRHFVTATDRLQAARAERRSLLRRLENATTDEEVEAIRTQLDIVAGEINGLRAQLRNLRLRTNYAVVNVSLLAKDGDEGGGGAGSFDDALGDASDLLVTVAGLIVRALAVLLPLGLIALVAWLAGRALRRRQRESALA